MIEQQLSMELELFFEEPAMGTEMLSITLPYPQRPFTTPLIPDHGIYWHSGREQQRLITLGEVWSITLNGDHRFQQASQALEQLQKRWIHLDPEACDHLPRLFFQYAFSQHDPMQQEWQGFPNTLLQLPQLQLINHRAHQFITLSHPIDSTPREQILDHWHRELDALERLFDSPVVQKSISAHSPPRQHQPAPLKAAIDAIQQQEVEKIVLGQAEQQPLTTPISLYPALQRMERHTPKGVQLLYSTPQKQWIAAPPEQLLRKNGTQIETEALAGTVPRGNNPEEEQTLGARLLSDSTLQHEHQLVIDFIEQHLHPLCTQLEKEQPTRVHKLEHVQHLLTSFQGELKHDHSLFGLIEALHQSPAICGTPKSTSFSWLQQHHNSNRGYYCGGAGWITPEGDGTIDVLLRCALIDPEQVTFYAGAGLVADSDAEEEQAEIALKIESMVQTLIQP